MEDHPLDSIAVGIVEARSFLFCYDDIDNKVNKRNNMGLHLFLYVA